MYNVGDLVICDGDSEIYLFIGEGGWSGWGEFVRMKDGYVCQMAKITCSKW